VLALALVGCADSPSAVRGTYAYRFPDGTTVPVDLSASQFQVYVADGTGFVVYPPAPVAGTADGTFEIANVPDGPYLLRRSAGTFYGEFTPADDHDFRQTFDVLGRPDAAPASHATQLQIDAAGLAAWQPGDHLVVDCFGNATELDNPPLDPPLAAEAREVHASLAWGNGYSWGPNAVPYLMDPAAGDELVIGHQTVRRTGDLITRSLAQIFVAPAPAQADAQTAAVAGGFVDVPTTAQVTTTVHGEALAALLPAGTTAHDFGVSVIVGPGTASSRLLGPELASVTTMQPATAATTTVHYGDPLDPAWPPVVFAAYDAVRDARVPIKFTAFSETVPLDGDRYTFQPLFGLGDVTIAATAPADAPITVPHGQRIRVDVALPAGTTGGRLIVWEADTQREAAYVTFDHAPIDLPPDIFEDSQRYALQLDAFADDGHGRLRTAGTYTRTFQLVAQ
jgi:hypothetical protein